MTASPKLDRIDINILAQLQKNGRLANVELAEAIGLSPSPCLSRVRRLEDAGYIVSYCARLHLSKLVEHRREDFIKFEADIRRYEALQECHLVSGGYDYLLKFVIKNVARYQELMESILDRNIGVEKYFSYIVIKTVFDRGPVPLKSLMGEK